MVKMKKTKKDLIIEGFKDEVVNVNETMNERDLFWFEVKND